MTEMYFDPKYVKTLTSDDFTGAKLKNKGLSVIFFYATYCGYCTKSKPDYVKFAQTCLFLDVYAMDGPNNTQVKECINIEHNNIITGWPTIIFFDKGEPVYVVEAENEARTANSLKEVAMSIKNGKIPV